MYAYDISDQYLKGEAKDLIMGCQHKDASIGYPEAKALLVEKYGDPYKISNAYIKKTADWPTIASGDNAALDQLSIFLCSCVSAMESMKYLSILDHPQNLQNLVKKLPVYLQDRWRRQVVKRRETKNNAIPGFKDFIKLTLLKQKPKSLPILFFPEKHWGRSSSQKKDQSLFSQEQPKTFTAHQVMLPM